jgi:hypothetical protein
MRQRWVLIGSWKDGVVVIVSDFALIVLNPMRGSLAQDGIKPQRTSDSSRSGSFGCRRMIGTGCVGTML